MKRVFIIFFMLLFVSMFFLQAIVAKEDDMANSSIEIYYCPRNFNKKAIKGRKIYQIDGYNYILIYKGSQSLLSKDWIEKIDNSPICRLTKEEIMNLPKTGLEEGDFIIVITKNGINHKYCLGDNFGYIYDEDNKSRRKCDILNDIYAYFAKEKFKDFGLGSINVYYDINCNPYPDGIPEK